MGHQAVERLIEIAFTSHGSNGRPDEAGKVNVAEAARPACPLREKFTAHRPSVVPAGQEVADRSGRFVLPLIEPHSEFALYVDAPSCSVAASVGADGHT
jgi:hypothetical protein